MALRRKINHSRDSLACFEAYKSAFHIYRAILESFFHAYGAIVDNFVIVYFFLEKQCVPQYYRWLTCYVCARLCQCFGQGAVSIFGVINCVPATTPAHNVFCYFAVAHILTLSVNLAFRPKSGFKNKMSGTSRVRACNFGIGSGSGFKMRPFFNSVWVCMRGQQVEIERIHPPPTNSKIRLKSFCEVATLILGQMLLLLVRGYKWRFW